MAKQKSLKKTIKSNKKKKLNLKNLDFKKNWKKLTFSGALALLLFTSISFAGYTYIEKRNLEAQAAGWGNLVLSVANGFHKTYACKYGTTGVRSTYVNSSNSYPIFTSGGSRTTVGPISTKQVYISVSSGFTTSISSSNGSLWGSKYVYRSSLPPC